MKLSEYKKRIELSDRLVSYKIMDYVLEHFWAKALLLAANLGLSYWMTGYESIFDIFWIVLSTVLFVAAEFCFLAIGGIAEVSAEMLCDAICPRFDYVPPDLYKVYPEQRYRREENKLSVEEEVPASGQVSRQTQNQVPEEQKPLATESAVAAETVVENSQPKAVCTELPAEPEEPAWSLLPLAVAWYSKSQQDRGMDVTVIEARYVWYLCTLVLAVYGGDRCTADDFVENALRFMPEGYDELSMDIDIDTIFNEYTALTDALGEMEDAYHQMEDPEMFEYIHGVELFINTFEHEDDETKELVYECLDTLLARADELG